MLLSTEQARALANLAALVEHLLCQPRFPEEGLEASHLLAEVMVLLGKVSQHTAALFH